MNENLNLVEILKDCPKGTKLYSSVFGSVELDHIDIRANYPIVIRLKDLDVRECLTTEGTLFTEYDGECILFPSRDQRDWSKFEPKKEGLVSTCELKDCDILSYQTVRFATEEEKQILFDAIKERGYKWNAETKTLEKLVEPKFDPHTLQPFDRVLVRLTKDCIWNATFFSHYDKEVNWGCYPCVTTSCKSYDKCIPYNDETKHLLGTSDEAPEYYRYWED